MSKYIKVSLIAILCIVFFVGCSIGKPAETTPQTTAEETYYFDPTDIVEMDVLGGSPEEEVIIGDIEVDVGISGDEGVVGEVIGDVVDFDSGSENYISTQDPQLDITEPPIETVPDPHE